MPLSTLKFKDLLSFHTPGYDLSIGPAETKRKSALVNAALEAADPSIRSLRVWNAGRFDPRLLKRFDRLETLTVFCWPDASLAPLAELRTLRELGVKGFSKVRDLAPLGELHRLEHVELSIAMSEVSLQKVRSLAPLGRLEHLRILSAYTVMPIERDFAATTRGRKLQYVHLGDWLTLEERAELVARGIAGRGELFQSEASCGKYDGLRVYLYGLTSRRKWYCTVCHAEMIAGHRARFAALVEAAEGIRVRGGAERAAKTGRR